MKPVKLSVFILFMICVPFMLSACGIGSGDTVTYTPSDNDKYVTFISADGTSSELNLSELYADESNVYEHVYSAINNWPSYKHYVGRGIKVSCLPGISPSDDFETVTFTSDDGYFLTITKEQLYADRYFYPGLEDADENGKEPVEAIIALEYREDSENLSEALDENPCFIMGQSNIYEHTTVGFIQNISTITVSNEDPGSWSDAYTYPEAGSVYVGDKIKLQHENFGAAVKLYYTTDGSDPTVYSTMYNPSTYQPELNVPIEITSDTTIKVLTVGYGKHDSGIAEFKFTVNK